MNATKHEIGLNHVYFQGRECCFYGEHPHGLLPQDAEELKRLVDESAWENGSSEEAYIVFEWP